MTTRDLPSITTPLAIVPVTTADLWIALPFKPESFIFTNDGANTAYVTATANNTTPPTKPTSFFTAGNVSGAAMVGANWAQIPVGTQDWKYPASALFNNPYLYLYCPTGTANVTIKITHNK